jgi:hypothetical protein
MARKTPKQQPLGLAVQAAHLKKHFPDAKTSVRRSCLHWLADLRPTELSCVYRISLEYKLKNRPKVRVLAPALRLPERKSEVHVFSDGTLCLYFMGEWNGRFLLVDTIVPWISEWLIHYEIWLVTEEWHGGGIHTDRKVA